MDKRQISKLRQAHQYGAKRSAHPIWKINIGDQTAVVERTQPETAERQDAPVPVEITAAPTNWELARDRQRMKLRMLHEQTQKIQDHNKKTTNPNPAPPPASKSPTTNKTTKTVPPPVGQSNTPPQNLQLKPAQTPAAPPAVQPTSPAVAGGWFKSKIDKLLGKTPNNPGRTQIPPSDQIRAWARSQMPNPMDVNKIIDNYLSKHKSDGTTDEQAEISALRSRALEYSQVIHNHRIQYIEYLIKNLDKQRAQIRKEEWYLKLTGWVRRQSLNDAVSHMILQGLAFLRDNSKKLVNASQLAKLAVVYKDAASKMQQIIHQLDIMEEFGLDISNPEKVLQALSRHKNGVELQKTFQQAIKAAGSYSALLDNVEWARSFNNEQSTNMSEVPTKTPPPAPPKTPEDYAGMGDDSVGMDDVTEEMRREVDEMYPEGEQSPRIKTPPPQWDPALGKSQLEELRRQVKDIETRPPPAPTVDMQDIEPSGLAVDKMRALHMQPKPVVAPTPTLSVQPQVPALPVVTAPPPPPSAPPIPQQVTEPVEVSMDEVDDDTVPAPSMSPEEALRKLRPHIPPSSTSTFAPPSEHPHQIPAPVKHVQYKPPPSKRQPLPLERELGINLDDGSPLDQATQPATPVQPSTPTAPVQPSQTAPTTPVLFKPPDVDRFDYLPEENAYITAGGAEDDFMVLPGQSKPLDFGAPLILKSKFEGGTSPRVLITSPIAQASGRGEVPAFIGQRVIIPEMFADIMKSWRLEPPKGADGQPKIFKNDRELADAARQSSMGIITGYAPDPSGEARKAWLQLYLSGEQITMWIPRASVEEDRDRGVAAGYQHPKLGTPEGPKQKRDGQQMVQLPPQAQQQNSGQPQQQQPPSIGIQQPMDNSTAQNNTTIPGTALNNPGMQQPTMQQPAPDQNNMQPAGTEQQAPGMASGDAKKMQDVKDNGGAIIYDSQHDDAMIMEPGKSISTIKTV